MTQKHTPGPWVAKAGLSRWNVTTTTRPRSHNICAVNTERPEQEANAALIAAAPDLLAEAEANARFLDQLAAHLEANDMPGQAGNCTIRAKATRAAIAKAEGRS